MKRLVNLNGLVKVGFMGTKFREASDDVFNTNERGVRLRKMDDRFRGTLRVWVNTARKQIPAEFLHEGLLALAQALEGTAQALRHEVYLDEKQATKQGKK